MTSDTPDGTSAARGSGSGAAEPASRTVLIVEDDPDIRVLVTDILGLEGYTVLAAADGREALALLGAGARPRCILLDLMMPGMNGWQFRKAQLADPAIADIPVLLLTGAPPTPEHEAELAAAGWLRKPIDIDELLASVNERR